MKTKPYLSSMILGVLLWLLTACLTTAVAQEKPAVAAAPMLEDRYPLRRVDFPGGVVSLPDLTYSTIPGFRPLTLDLYIPPRTSGPARPLVVYVHGGGWMSGHTRHSGAFENWPGVLASIAAKGYVVASIEYRLSGEAPFPAAVQDVKAAVRWLRAQGPAYGIDKQRAVIFGGSAGGQLAALTATSCGISALEPPAPRPAPGQPQRPSESAESDCVQGVAAWYGVFDFETVAAPSPPSGNDPPADAGSAVTRYLGCDAAGCPPSVARSASPSAYVDSADPPVLLIHGSDDEVVPVAQSQDFEKRLREAGVPVELLVIPDVGHSFVGSTAERTRNASWKALDKTMAFIAATIGDKR